MDPLALIFSASGRLSPRPFSIAVILVYLAGFASQALLSGPVLARSGIWPFALTQAALAWIWFALHAKRLRDAGRGIGGAVGIAILYALAIVLLLLVVAFFLDVAAQDAATANDPNHASFITLLLVAYIFGMLFSPDFGFFTGLILALLLIAFAPGIIAFIFSIYAGTRPSLPPMAAPAAAPAGPIA